jgi:hypothetical protein
MDDQACPPGYTHCTKCASGEYKVIVAGQPCVPAPAEFSIAVNAQDVFLPAPTEEVRAPRVRHLDVDGFVDGERFFAPHDVECLAVHYKRADTQLTEIVVDRICPEDTADQIAQKINQASGLQIARAVQ